MLGEARIALRAIAANAAILVARDEACIADVSFDGFGHGAEVSARAAIAGGVTRLVVGSGAEAAALASVGLTATVSQDHRGANNLYGLGPDRDYEPAMSVSAPVLGTKRVEPGDGVSYGYTFRATARSTLALVGIGYADGLDRAASNVGTLLLGGVSRRIVGRVAMNVLMVDLGDSSVEPGEHAIVFDVRRRPSDWAMSIGRQPAEVAIEFGTKLSRVWS